MLCSFPRKRESRAIYSLGNTITLDPRLRVGERMLAMGR